ncbi:MAG: hypothetical protein NUK65_01520 [Firmicutes bacterium]|nr:hypothetical protein [Bacillota bacterium]
MKNMRWVGLALFIMTGIGLVVNSSWGQTSAWVVLLVMLAVCYTYGLLTHCTNHLSCVKENTMPSTKSALLIIFLATFAASLTWFLNHEMGLGPIVASGLVGVMAGSLLAPAHAGPVYTASFVGMSASLVVASLSLSIVTGFVVGVIIVATMPVFAGIGGKGGTTAATAVVVTRTFLNYFSS